MLIYLQSEDFDAAAMTAALRARAGSAAGAIATFTGYVRDHSAEIETRSLFLEHYQGMCESVLRRIVDEAASRWRVIDVALAHRFGELAQGEQIVFVAVASAHRADAFAACEYIMDALKTRAPFWKRETLADGQAYWVQARESDQARADAWQAPTADGAEAPGTASTQTESAGQPVGKEQA